MLINHPLIVQKPLEFIELKKSIYYNLAMIYKDKGDSKNALYFYFNFYKLNPDNVSVVVEIAILCRKEMMLDQSLYFFEMAFAKDNSPAMKLIYLEQIAILNFAHGSYHESLQKINLLIGADFKKNVLSELGQLILEEIGEREKDKHDFFSSSYQYCPPIKSQLEARKIPYISKILELREEYSRRKLLPSQLSSSTSSSDRLQTSNRMEEEFITITLREPKWKEILNSLLMILKIQKFKENGTTLKEIESKIKSSSSFNHLSNIDFDIFSSKFKFNLIRQEKPEPIQNLLPSISPLKVEELIREKPREERYGGGQMNLREKKTSIKQPEVLPTNPEVVYSKGLESCIQSILKETLDSDEYMFFQVEVIELIGGKTPQESKELSKTEVEFI
jgi:tetratricopeptide (TPR) repeat protein